MVGKSLFEILAKKDLNFAEEIQRIEELFTSKIVHKYCQPCSLEEFINDNVFRDWECRYRCIDTYDFRKTLGIQSGGSFSKKCSIEQFVTYLGYISNMLLIFYDVNIPQETEERLKHFCELGLVIFKNVDDCLDKMGMTRLKVPNERKIIIVVKNPNAVAVAENMKDEPTAYKIMEYTRYLLKGDLDRKKAILLHLYNKFEPMREKLNGRNFKEFGELVGALFNSAIRHNNTEGKKKNPYLENITQEELEKIYDNAYDLIILCFMLNDYIDKKPELEELRKKLTERKNDD